MRSRPPGLGSPGRAKKDAHDYSSWALPLLGSNQDSPDPESGVLPVTPRGSESSQCGLEPHLLQLYGAEGDRTPDLCSAIAALSQLSYSPDKGRKIKGLGGRTVGRYRRTHRTGGQADRMSP